MAVPVLILTTTMSYRVKVTLSGHIAGTHVSIVDYCQPFIEQAFNPRTRQWYDARKYRYYDLKTHMLYMPRYDLDRFITFLNQSNVDYNVVPLQPVAGEDVSIPMQPWFKAKDDLQKDAIDYLINDPSPLRGLALQTGRGKGQPLETKIKTPGGWTTMGEVSVGDQILAWDGSVTSVTGVFPNGEMPLYKFTFEDGRSTTCDDTHLWKICIDGKWCIESTISIISLLSLDHVITIPLFKNGADFSEAEHTWQFHSERQAYAFQESIFSRGGICSCEQDIATGKWLVTSRSDTVLKIKSVEPLGKVETKCIAIEHPDRLYVCDEYIVTHNTASLIAALSGIGKRGLILVPSMIEQWTNAILKFTQLTPDDIYIVQGMPSLAKLLKRIDKSLFPKIILASIPTLRSYLEGSDSYVNFPPFTELCERLGVGVVSKDETHLQFHANFLLDLTLNPTITIPMTATFETGSPNIVDIFNAHYPSKIRFGEEEYDSYVDVYSYGYQLDARKLPKHMFRGSMGYSQVKFEYWLLTKGKPQLQTYLEDVVGAIINMHYINVSSQGERLLILCSMVEMCEEVIAFIKRTYKDKTVTLYVGETDDAVLSTHDIIVSTPKSAGTGRDIPDLRTVLVTVSARSSPLNKQMLGRLRKLPSGNVPIFVYTHCVNVPSHVDHARHREVLFTPLAKSIKHYMFNGCG